jgi:hypothetical protein
MFPRGKGGRYVGLTTFHVHVPIVLKSGSLNLLEPSGPVKACNGTALALHVKISAVQVQHFPPIEPQRYLGLICTTLNVLIGYIHLH